MQRWIHHERDASNGTKNARSHSRLPKSWQNQWKARQHAMRKESSESITNRSKQDRASPQQVEHRSTGKQCSGTNHDHDTEQAESDTCQTFPGNALATGPPLRNDNGREWNGRGQNSRHTRWHVLLSPTDCQIGNDGVEESHYEEAPQVSAPALHDPSLKWDDEQQPERCYNETRSNQNQRRKLSNGDSDEEKRCAPQCRQGKKDKVFSDSHMLFPR